MRLGLGVLAALGAALTLGAAAAAQEGRIINGGFGIYIPWQAAIVPVNEQGTINVPLEVFCGATVRDATHVVTAAHCLPDSNAASIAVVAGTEFRSSPNPTAEALAVTAITSHPGFGLNGQANDLALLTLAAPGLTLNSGSDPITPLPVGGVNVDDTGKAALISGWGNTDPNPNNPPAQPDGVSNAVIDILPDSACAGYEDSYVPAVMMCAGRTATDPNTGQQFTIDTCQGDSGGPLARATVAQPQTIADFDFLIGVVSFGRGCADPAFPGVYTWLANPDLNARANDPNPPARLEPVGAPAVGGTPQAGQTLTCAGDTWTDPAPQRDVLWLSAALTADNPPQATDIQIAGQGPTLAVAAGLVNRIVTCEVRATNAGGARTAQAQPVGPVTPAPPAPPPPPPPVTIPADIQPPVASITRRRCARRRCSLTITASDSGGPATRASVKIQRITGCKRGRRGARCRRAITRSARRISPGVFQLTTGRLVPARYRFTVTAFDAAGNRSRSVAVVLTVRR